MGWNLLDLNEKFKGETTLKISCQDFFHPKKYKYKI